MFAEEIGDAQSPEKRGAREVGITWLVPRHRSPIAFGRYRRGNRAGMADPGRPAASSGGAASISELDIARGDSIDDGRSRG